MSVPAEEVRKLKARVDELEKMRGRLSYNEKMERSSQDAVQGVAPRLGEGLGKSGLDGYNQEDIWQFVRARLMTEQENGEHITGAKASSSQSWLLYMEWCLFRAIPSAPHSALLTALGWREDPYWYPILWLEKLRAGEHCPTCIL